MTATTPFTIGEVPWDVFSSDASFAKMTDCDVAVVVFARNSGEGYDICSGVSTVGPEGNEILCTDALSVADGSKTGNNYLELNKAERDLLRGLKALKDEGKLQKLVVLLNTSNVMQVDFLNPSVEDEYGVDAALWLGATGQSGVEVIGEILNGSCNPSGKLADTICYDILREPSIYNFGTNIYGRWAEDGFAALSAKESSDAELSQKFYNVYREGIYVGYRYYETRYEDYVLGNTDDFSYADIVARSFGEGMSYTSFAISDFRVNEEGDGFQVAVKVTNTGDVAGKETVQVYAQSPYTQYDRDNGIEKASVQLVGFEKTGLLQPGESQEVTVSFDKRSLAAYDAVNARTYMFHNAFEYFRFYAPMSAGCVPEEGMEWASEADMVAYLEAPILAHPDMPFFIYTCKGTAENAEAQGKLVDTLLASGKFSYGYDREENNIAITISNLSHSDRFVPYYYYHSLNTFFH